jgi:hypothetical protein
MTILSDLLARKATIAADLAAMTKASIGGKPNAGGDGGLNVDHVQWRMSLYKELDEINALILAESAAEAAANGDDGSWEVVSE